VTHVVMVDGETVVYNENSSWRLSLTVRWLYWLL